MVSTVSELLTSSSGVVYMSEYTMGGGLFYQPGWPIEAGYSATDGQQLWITNRTQIPYTLISAGAGTYFAGDGYYVEFTQNALSITVTALQQETSMGTNYTSKR